MFKRKVMLLGFVFTLFVSLCLPVQVEAKSSSVIAILEEVNGDVTFVKGGGKRSFTAYNGAALRQGDSVRTGKDSSVNIVLENEDEVVLGADSHILISELVEGNTSIKLSSGGLWSKVKRFFGASDTYEIQTPTAIMGVRGTLFHVDVNADDAMLRVFDGLVGVQGSRDNDEREVAVFEQHRTGDTDESSDKEQLDLRSYLQEADASIIVQTLQDIIETIELRGARALERGQAYHETGEKDELINALQDAHQSVLLAELSQAITQEIQQSPRLGEIQYTMIERGLGWGTLLQQTQSGLRESNDIARQIEAIADDANISTSDREPIEQPINDKIEQIRDSQPPSTGGSSGGSSPDPGTDPGTDPGPGSPTAMEVIATIEEEVCDEDIDCFVAQGTYEGIQFRMIIPRLPEDGDTLTITIDKPSPELIEAEAGPVNALSIMGLEDRDVMIGMNMHDSLRGENYVIQSSLFDYVGDGRWKPRESQINLDLEGIITVFDRDPAPVSVVAAALKVPVPVLNIYSQSEEGITLKWFSDDGLTTELLKDGEVIASSDQAVSEYLDSDVKNKQTYAVRAVKGGFESELSNEETVYREQKAEASLTANDLGTQLVLNIESIPLDTSIVGVELHLGFEFDYYVYNFEQIASKITFNSTLLGDANPDYYVPYVKGFNDYNSQEQELLLTEVLFNDGIAIGHNMTGEEYMVIDLTQLWEDPNIEADKPINVRILKAQLIDVNGGLITLEYDESSNIKVIFS